MQVAKWGVNNDLMVSEFEGLNALKVMNCDEERRK